MHLAGLKPRSVVSFHTLVLLGKCFGISASCRHQINSKVAGKVARPSKVLLQVDILASVRD